MLWEGRQGRGGGKRTFFSPPLSLRRWLVRTKINRLRWSPLHHFSFLLRLLRALLSCCRFNPAVTVLGSQEHNQPQGPPCPNQRNACRNRCKGRFWSPSWHVPSWEGKRRSEHAQGCWRVSRCHTEGKHVGETCTIPTITELGRQGMWQFVECLPSIHGALGSVPNTM